MMMKRGQRVLTVFIVLFVMSVTWLVSPFYTYGAELTGNGTVSENDSMDREETEETETEETEKEGKGNVLQEEAAGDDHGQDSITIEPDGTLFGQSDVYIKVTGGSLIETTETDPDWSLHYNQAASKLTLKNFRYTVGNDDRYEYAGIGFYATTDGQEGSAFKTLQLELIGENSVSCPRGEALSVGGSLDITGSGSLSATTTYTVGTPDQDDPSQTNYACAVFVGEGRFSNTASLVCKSENAGDIDLLIMGGIADVAMKGGKVTGKVCIAGEGGGTYNGLRPFTDPVVDKSGLVDYRSGGRAYYFMKETEDVFYPNQIMGEQEEDQWLIVGEYDENGKPKPSSSYYQVYYYLKNGSPITNDFHYPVMYLLYEDSAVLDTKPGPKDIVDIADGKSHTFNTDLYALHLREGNAVVNGNVTLDVACFEQYGRIGETGDEAFTIYERDDSGNIIFYGDSRNSNVVVNGDAGALSLHKSYKGNASVNGNINFIAYYDDVNAKDGEAMPETDYGAMADAGKVIDGGSFVAKVAELRGYVGYGVFENVCYSKTVDLRNGESVQGTSVAIDKDALLVGVAAAGIDEETYPCVKKPDEAELTEIKDALTDPSSKVLAMDIMLIQDDTKEVEPDRSVNLYIDNLTGFKKPALFHIKADGSVEKLYVGEGGSFNGNIVCPTNEFSTYFVAEDQDISILKEGPDTWKGKTGTEGFVLRLYNLAMGREADSSGFADWTGRLDTKKSSAAEVARGFFFSKEFENAAYTDAQYVKLLYRTMLGREADKAGLDGWLKLLEEGVSREYIFRGFAESGEFTNLCADYGVERGGVTLAQERDKDPAATGFIARLYTKMLGRKFDQGGLNDWCGRYASGETIEKIATVGFLHSQELKEQNLSDGEFVTRMYQTFLNREPDEEGYNYWLGRLKSGETTRDDLVYGFTRSKEFEGLKEYYGVR